MIICKLIKTLDLPYATHVHIIADDSLITQENDHQGEKNVGGQYQPSTRVFRERNRHMRGSNKRFYSPKPVWPHTENIPVTQFSAQLLLVLLGRCGVYLQHSYHCQGPLGPGPLAHLGPWPSGSVGPGHFLHRILIASRCPVTPQYLWLQGFVAPKSLVLPGTPALTVVRASSVT